MNIINAPVTGLSNTFSNGAESELAFIKNQIVKQLFTELDAAKMKIILDTLGCKALADCQVLYDISSISYTVTNTLFAKRYVGRGDRTNKKLLKSFNVTVTNNSTSKQELNATMPDFTANQEFEVTITKADQLFTGTQSIAIPFTANAPLGFIFNKNDAVSAKQTQPFVLKEQLRTVTLNAFKKTNVTYNIFQFDEFNHYLMDFNIDKTSVISHPTVNPPSTVAFVKTNFLDFMKLHPTLVTSLKFKNSTGITLAKSASGTDYTLNNFPAVEKITNFEVETVYSAPESIPKPTKPPMTTTTQKPDHSTSTTTSAPNTTTTTVAPTTTSKPGGF